MTTITNMAEQIRTLELDIEPADYLPDDDKRVAEIISLAMQLLITDKGYCNWHNINNLERYGYRVTAGEQDSFGWLSGCIHTSKGIIVYG